MPGLPPGLEPLPLDEAAIAAAVAALQRTALAIDIAAGTRARAALVAQEAWRGPARDRFDIGLGRVQHDAADLAADLRARAGAILRAAEETRAENARRAAERDRWAHNQLAAGG